MTAFEPPDFSFTGLQFNSLIFENPLTETIPDPLPITELDTNNIQAKTLGTPVTLYTNFNNVINLGGDLVTGITTKAKAGFSFFDVYSKSFNLYGLGAGLALRTFLSAGVSEISHTYYTDLLNTSVNSVTIVAKPSSSNPTIVDRGLYQFQCGSFYIGHILSGSLTAINRQIRFLLETLGTISQVYYADENNTTVKSAEITVLSQSSLFDNQGRYEISAASLKTPNTIVSSTLVSSQNLFTTTTAPINIGTASSNVNILSTLLSTPNTIVSNTLGSNQSLFDTTTAPIIIGTASSSVQILSTSLTIPNTIVSKTTGSIQNVFGTTTNEIRIGAAASAINLLSNVLANNIGVVDPLSTVVSLFNNFAVGTTSTLAFGNIYLVSLTTRAKALITYFDTYNLRSNSSNQRIQQTFPSTTTHTESYFIDNFNATVETCRIAVSQGSTPLVNNTGQLTLTGGQIGVIGDTVNLSNTGASSVINLNAQLVPAYAYNTTTGVLNSSAIGYTKFGAASVAGLLTNGVNVTRSTISISVDGVYQMNHCNAILSTAGSNIIYFRSYVYVLNGSGVFQANLGVSNVTFISTVAADIFYMNGSGVFVVTGATVVNPFTFNLILSPVFFANVFASSNNDFRFSVTRIA